MNRLVIFLLFLAPTLWSQDYFISTDNKSISSLNELELKTYKSILQSPFYSDLSIASVGKIKQVQIEGYIKVDIPNDDCDELIFKASEVNFNNDGDYTWVGKLENNSSKEDCLCKLGSITIVSSKSGKIGHIQVDDKVFEILPLSDSSYVIADVDESKFDAHECAVKSSKTSKDIYSDIALETRSLGNCTTRCLVLFTDNTVNMEGSLIAVENRINLAIAQTNTALLNSNVDDCELRIELAAIEKLNFTESFSIFDDVTRLRDNTTINDIVENLRNVHDADIVVLLAGENYFDGFGIVSDIGPNEEEPYAVVSTGAATTGRYTFAHEVAHLFGARHEETNDNIGRIEHGHEFKTGNFLPCVFGSKQRTIMHTLDEGSRIQHFSNPSVYYDGTKTGKDGIRENANKLKSTACTVSSFKQTFIPTSLYIVNDNCSCPCDDASLSAVINTSTAGVSFTFEWEYSIDGINWTVDNYFNGTSFSYQMPCTEDNTIFFRTTAIGSDGTSITSSTESITSTILCQAAGSTCAQERNSLDNKLDAIVSITSNPTHTNQLLEIDVEILKEGNYSLNILKESGVLQSTIFKNTFIERGHHYYNHKIAHPGIYFIRVTDGDGITTTEKLLVI